MNYHKLIPICVIYDWAQYADPLTKDDAQLILQTEIDFFEEGQDGALSSADIKKCRTALKKVKAS